jgi:hypothetical protein
VIVRSTTAKTRIGNVKTKGQRKREETKQQRAREKRSDAKQDIMAGRACRRKWGGGVAK